MKKSVSLVRLVSKVNSIVLSHSFSFRETSCRYERLSRHLHTCSSGGGGGGGGGGDGGGGDGGGGGHRACIDVCIRSCACIDVCIRSCACIGVSIRSCACIDVICKQRV